MSNSNSARDCRALHRPGLRILPNAWVAASAHLIKYAGADSIFSCRLLWKWRCWRGWSSFHLHILGDTVCD